MTELTDAVNALNARLQVHLAGLDRPVLVTEGAPAGDEGVEGVYALDVDGLAFYGPKTGSSWGAPRVFGGVDGREVELRSTATHIQWRYVGDASWINLLALSGLTGADGAPGASAYEVAVAEGFVGDEAAWLASLVGPTGPEGPPGDGSGDVLGPATHGAGLVPTWAGADTKTLGAGRAIGASGSTDLLDRAAGDGRYVRTVNGNGPDGSGNVAVSGGGGGGDTAAVFDYTLHRMRQDMGSSPLLRRYGFADPLQTTARINTAGSTGAYYATGYAQNQPTSGDGATPTVESTASVGIGTAATSHSLTGLAGAANGREVILLVAQDGTGTATATIGGQAMTQIGTSSNASVRLTILRRNLTGAETNLNITMTTSSSTTIAAQAYLISGMQGTPEAAFGTTFIDPPSLSPSWGASNTLWLAVTAHEADRGLLAMTNYTNALVTGAAPTGSFTGSLCTLGSARRARNASSEDPGGWSIQGSFSGNTVSATVAIRAGLPAAEAMDLRWSAYALPAVPATMSMQFAIEVLGGTLTPGTTLRAYLSRDAGTTFTEVTLDQISDAGGVYVFNALGVDVSGQPAGDDVSPRLTATSALTVRVLDMAVLAGG